MSSSSIRSLIVLNYAQIICGLRKVLIATLKFSGLWLARHGWRSLNHQNQSYTAVLFLHELEDFFFQKRTSLMVCPNPLSFFVTNKFTASYEWSVDFSCLECIVLPVECYFGHFFFHFPWLFSKLSYCFNQFTRYFLRICKLLNMSRTETCVDLAWIAIIFKKRTHFLHDE